MSCLISEKLSVELPPWVLPEKYVGRVQISAISVAELSLRARLEQPVTSMQLWVTSVEVVEVLHGKQLLVISAVDELVLDEPPAAYASRGWVTLSFYVSNCQEWSL